MGIEPTSKAWEAFVLPLNYARSEGDCTPVPEERSAPPVGVRRCDTTSFIVCRMPLMSFSIFAGRTREVKLAVIAPMEATMTAHIVINPYAPPKARVDASLDVTTVQAFPRFSTWGVFLLTFVTVGLYPVYWLYTRTRILNRVLPSNPVPVGLAVAAVIALLASAAASFLNGMYPDHSGVGAMSSVINIVSGIVNLVWVFMFRNRLNQHFVPHEGDRYRLSGVLTFFFTVLYLQYKLNQLIDRERTVSAGDPLVADLAA